MELCVHLWKQKSKTVEWEHLESVHEKNNRDRIPGDTGHMRAEQRKRHLSEGTTTGAGGAQEEEGM